MRLWRSVRSAHPHHSTNKPESHERDKTSHQVIVLAHPLLMLADLCQKVDFLLQINRSSAIVAESVFGSFGVFRTPFLTSNIDEG